MSLYKDVKDLFDEKITVQKLIILTPKIISIVQEVGAIRKLNGLEKKDLFFETIGKIIEESDLNKDEKEALDIFVESALPFIVDAVVYAYKSEVFKHIKKKTRKCIGSCFKSDYAFDE